MFLTYFLFKLRWTGRTCDTQINPCSPNPCINGKCSVSLNTYTCTCNAGFTGKNCDTSRSKIENFKLYLLNDLFRNKVITTNNKCSPSPCQNGGICVETISSYSCFCPQGNFEAFFFIHYIYKLKFIKDLLELYVKINTL